MLNCSMFKEKLSFEQFTEKLKCLYLLTRKKMSPSEKRRVIWFPTIRRIQKKKTFPQKRFQEQTLGGSPVQPLLRITGRPGQIHNTGSRTSHQTDGINMEKNTPQNKTKNLTLNRQGHKTIINIFIVTKYNRVNSWK